MKTRILSGLLMTPLLILVYLGGYWLLGFCFFISTIGILEFYRGFRKIGIRPSVIIGVVLNIALYSIAIFKHKEPAFITLWVSGAVVLSMLYLFNMEKQRFEDSMATLLGVLYIGFFSYHIVLLDLMRPPGLVWFVVVGAFGTDIFAYFTGMAIGKHKLSPNISPKKTIEGSLGGILGSVILSAGVAAILFPGLWYQGLIIGLISGIVSQLGDLTASVFKRKMGIKDFGDLIPGHGGILDRFDSIIFTAPMIYYYTKIFIPSFA